MKLNAALAKSLLMAASIGVVVPLIAQTVPKKDAPKQPAKPATPKAAPAPAPAAPAEEAEITLPGAVITRASGGFLSLTVEGGHFKLSFYDVKKKPASADAVRATARWDPVNKPGVMRTVLLPAGGNQALTGNTFVQPPFVFKVYLSLIGPDDAVLESHVIDFRG